MSEVHGEIIVRSHCRNYYRDCGILVHVKEGHIISVEGTPEFPALPY